MQHNYIVAGLDSWYLRKRKSITANTSAVKPANIET